MKPSVSVVVTCYNHEKYIKQCLNSIFHQTFTNFDLIIMNDGSTDQSGKLIEEMIENTCLKQEIKYIDKENEGLVVTRNKALKMIETDYFLFVDSDNYLSESYIEDLIQTAEYHNADIVYGNLVNPEDNSIYLATNNFNLSELFKGNFIDSCSLVRSSILNGITYDTELNYKKLEDYDFFLNLIVSNNAVAVPCHEAYFYYRVLESSMSQRDDFKEYYRLYSYILNKHIATFPKEIGSAINFHFEQLTDLDIEASIKKEKLLVVAINSNQEEEILVDRKIFFTDSITFEVPRGIKTLRIRMSNIPSFYRRISLKTSNCQTEVLPVKANAHIDNHSYVFSDFYPFIEFDLTPYLDNQFVLEYERFNISDITSETYIANELIKVIESKNQSLAESDSLLLESQKTNDDSLRLMELQSEYDELFQKYHAVIGSRRWIFPTKIINFFRRKK
ncbi:glycosyltransferase family A protein [Streptococcus hyovaginalis]|uniref:glycosyltransferase family 2 protein n=1 Tax=Streptococcus hyovaginalis TaxID=149015 RepID=UPI002A824998|nr:glycosyltransferase family A protein [Streptococcus hyovaginalis]MDY4511206.1 glycosyltransferase family A protein [Streptococcus hyovaginalis]